VSSWRTLSRYFLGFLRLPQNPCVSQLRKCLNRHAHHISGRTARKEMYLGSETLRPTPARLPKTNGGRNSVLFVAALSVRFRSKPAHRPDLLQAARPHPPEIRSSDLNTTVEHAVGLARQQVPSVSIKIELQKDPRLPNVEHDSGLIYQVVLNLLLNAVQAIDGEGTIHVEISLSKGDAAITVVDTGRGIAPEHLAHIFRPFYTTKGNGTGLGLSMARRTVADHHGRIEVSSEVGKGTTFSVFLPLQQVTAQAVAS